MFPYQKQHAEMKKLFIIKIGGNIIDDEDKLSSFLKDFAAIIEDKILVHGGGKLATTIAEAMGIPQQMVEGRRITDAETLKLVTMVYAGYINKNIVALLQSKDCNAIGLSGADGNLIQAHKRINEDKKPTDDGEHTKIDYGFAGDIDAVNATLLQQLLSQKSTPVIAPITHNKNGTLLNTNADTIANETAKAMAVFYDVSLIYCFEKNGVLLNAADDDGFMPAINVKEYAFLKNKNIITAGMIPKLDNAFAALHAGVQQITIGHAASINLLIHQKAGTAIIHE